MSEALKEGHEHDWQGHVVPKPISPDEKLTVWEVTPHIQTDSCDSMVERGWQEMLSTVGTGLDAWLERYTEEELREGVTLTFRLIDMNADEMPDDSDVI